MPAFSALTLLVWHQEEHLACKKWVVRYWHGYLSAARCNLHMVQVMLLLPHHLLPQWNPE